MVKTQDEKLAEIFEKFNEIDVSDYESDYIDNTNIRNALKNWDNIFYNEYIGNLVGCIYFSEGQDKTVAAMYTKDNDTFYTLKFYTKWMNMEAGVSNDISEVFAKRNGFEVGHVSNNKDNLKDVFGSAGLSDEIIENYFENLERMNNNVDKEVTQRVTQIVKEHNIILIDTVAELMDEEEDYLISLIARVDDIDTDEYRFVYTGEYTSLEDYPIAERVFMTLKMNTSEDVPEIMGHTLETVTEFREYQDDIFNTFRFSNAVDWLVENGYFEYSKYSKFSGPVYSESDNYHTELEYDDRFVVDVTAEEPVDSTFQCPSCEMRVDLYRSDVSTCYNCGEVFELITGPEVEIRAVGQDE